LCSNSSVISLEVNAFCFSFTDLGRRELTERKRKTKKKERKAVDHPGYLILLPAVPSCLTNRQAGSNCLTLSWAVRCFKKIV
jgi:hypothetical protein